MRIFTLCPAGDVYIAERVDLYLKVRRAHFQDGLSGRQIARDFGISRDSVSKMLAYSEPPGYRRTAEIRRPKLDPYVDQIDQWLSQDKVRPRKQRHTAKRIFERLRDECGFDGGYTIVKDGSVAMFRISVALPGVSNQTRHFPWTQLGLKS